MQPSTVIAKRPRRASSGTSPAAVARVLKISRSEPPAPGSAHGSPIATTENRGNVFPVSLRINNRVASWS